MIKIGVLGVGHLGSIHLKLLKEILYYDIVGFYDPNDVNANKAISNFGVKRFSSMEELIEAVEAVDIVTPASSHFECASKALKLSRHLFIEKPLANTLKEARSLRALAAEADVKVQVGHVERFNPAFLAGKDFLKNPMFIESQRLAQFNPRGNDVSVVLDLMIHDIDIVLSVVRSNIKRISASGVAVVGESPDITNARIEFDNGCVASLTVSRISSKNVRRSRFYQKDACITINFLDKETNVIRLKEPEGKPDPQAITIDAGEENGIKQIYYDNPKVEPVNAIKMELESFAESILNNTDTAVGIDDGYNALEVANRIIEKVNHTTDFLSDHTISV